MGPTAPSCSPHRCGGAAGTAAGYLATVGSALGLLIAAATIGAFGLLPTMVILGVGVVVAALLTTLLPETIGTDLAWNDSVGGE